MKSNFGDILGHLGAVLGHFGTLKDLCKGPRVVQHDKISCNIPMGSVLVPFGVILVIFSAILVLFWALLGAPWAPEKGPWWSNMLYNHVIYPWEVFRVIWGHAVPF